MRMLSIPRIVLPLLLGLVLVSAPAHAETLSAWQLTTPLPIPRVAPAMAATATHVYVLGGATTTTCTPINSVIFAPILPDGSLGAWTATTALTFPRGYLGGAVVGKWLYVVGGANGCGLVEATKYATVERAEILPDGTLGPWTAMASLTHGRAHMPVVTDGLHLYAVGGFDGSRTASVEMTSVLLDGSLAAWQAVAGMTVGRDGPAAGIANGKLYAAGGLGSGLLASSEGATIQAGGTLAPWAAMAALPTVRYQPAGAGVAGSFWVTGGTNDVTDFNTTVQAVVDGSSAITGWTAGPVMNVGRSGHAVAVSGNRLYVAGGWSGGQWVSSVEFATAAQQPVAMRIGVYRAGQWYLDKNGNGVWDGCATDGCIAWGGDPSDKVVLGDWNGSGTTKIGVYRTGTWFLDTNGNGAWDGCGVDSCLSWGGDPTDVPVVGDWNGSGTTKIGVYRASGGTWYLDANGNGVWDGCATDKCVSWGGAPDDVPIVGKW